MFKNKIALKLSLYFAIALLVLSVIIGSLFIFLFRNQTIEMHKTELSTRADSIALTLSECIDEMGTDLKEMGTSGLYLHFIGDIAGTDVWIVDDDLTLITGGTRHSMVNPDYKYSDLPQNADSIVQEVFEGKTVFSEDFSDVLSELTLTVGVPIKTNKGVVGVVLLHSPVKGVNNAIANGIMLLTISIIAALLIAFLISIKFSFYFTKPLSKMKDAALLLADGNYTAKSNVRQNDEIGQLADTLDILADRLDLSSKESEKLEQMRRDFVANISHELRTPITVVRGSLEALVENVVTEPAQVADYHRQMLNETLFLQRLVGDLLDLSRLQNMDFVIEKQEVSVCDVIDDVIRSVSQIFNKKGIKILTKKNNEDYTVFADYGRLRQMLMIILENAIKFSDDNGIVELTLKNKILSIRDYGIGIPNADLPYIFDRFYKSRSEQNKMGTGLGLSIAKQIAERHSIKLTVSSSEGEYTEFRFEF